MELDYDNIYEFLLYHRYPTGFSKNQKRILRRKSQEHFRVKQGLLFYSRVPRSKTHGHRDWKQVPRTAQDQERIIEACHSSLEGKLKQLTGNRLIVAI